MADFTPKASEDDIRKRWDADAPINTAELAIIMKVNRSTVSQWNRRGMPRVGKLIRKSTFNRWWAKESRSTHSHTSERPRSRSADKSGEQPSKSGSPAPLPPQAARLLERAS